MGRSNDPTHARPGGGSRERPINPPNCTQAALSQQRACYARCSQASPTSRHNHRSKLVSPLLKGLLNGTLARRGSLTGRTGVASEHEEGVKLSRTESAKNGVSCM